ncbi:MAG: nitroreductase [Marivirga sp.]|jgi:nitroreductase
MMPKDFNTIEINRLIRDRRSIYPTQYSGENVPDEIVKQMLENANWAPNHKKTEPWRFTVFTADGLQQLAKFQSELYQRGAEKKGDFDQEKFNKLASKPLMASHVIAIAMKRNPVVPEVEEIAAVACAVQNMYLTATAYGIGCYWGSGGITYLDDAKEHFGLQPEDKLLGFLYVGMPKEGLWPEGKRGAYQEKTHWVRG